ncbi:zinc/manganese transporter permease [Candidatus Tenderia electrophaga]|jgi:zinc/manganese transport system permease protein|uniref:Zinc/manganese transporter permease n=1 Tax=Candidatus Tenderia electrophaga TaxID=1748243 RepID=A0A0S2TBS9_9GAMM|nr:zinc/manganese transporter permease [Candidatus Tenderia electrophaga]
MDAQILWPALAAGLLVLATHVPLGREVLARGIIFLDLAVAQVAGLGLIVAAALGFGGGSWQLQLIAVSGALLAAVVLNWSEKRWPEVQEALIGTLFVLAASAGILLLSHNPHGAEEMKTLLSGQLLWVTPDQLGPTAVLTLALLGVWFGLRRQLGRIGFYLLFAVSITASVQLVGVYLVFASLIIPALAVRRLQGRRALGIGYGVGVCGVVLGLMVSLKFDLPAGPAVVWLLALTAAVVALLLDRGKRVRNP